MVKRILFPFAGLFVVLALSFTLSGCGATATPSTETDEGSKPAAGSPTKETPEPKEPEVSTEFANALLKAQMYSDTANMSKKGLYEQLTSEFGEKFPAEAAQYAVDNLKVDYKENALKKAQSYSETMAMSKEGIYDQLISEYGENFTAEEAQYAVDNLK